MLSIAPKPPISTLPHQKKYFFVGNGTLDIHLSDWLFTPLNKPSIMLPRPLGLLLTCSRVLSVVLRCFLDVTVMFSVAI
jgi:hypothetical protein